MENVRGLYGSEFDKNRACAFCKHHRCYLTVKQLRQHGCLKKGCWHMIKNENHEWWKQREIVKQKRKIRKETINSWAS